MATDLEIKLIDDFHGSIQCSTQQNIYKSFDTIVVLFVFFPQNLSLKTIAL
jgi:hypothetical protein